MLGGVAHIARGAVSVGGHVFGLHVMGCLQESPNRSGDDRALHLAVNPDDPIWMPLNQNDLVVTPAEGPIQEFRSTDWTFHGTDHGA